MNTYFVHGQEVTFSNQSSSIKFIQGTMPYAKCGVDINNDGLDDIVRFSKEGVHIDLQQKDKRYTYKFYPMTLINLPLWSVSAGDLNGDYTIDLLLAGASGVSSLLYNAAQDRFEEYPCQGTIYSQRSTLQDIDGDGDIDAFVCNDEGRSQTYENDGKGHLTTSPSLMTISDLPGNYSAIWSDVDNDGKSDLYISKCRVDAKPGDKVRTNLLYHNNGNGSYTDVAKPAGVDDNAQSWSSAIEDFDNDGDMDIFVVNHDETNKFFRNNGYGTFTNIISDTGIDPYDLGGFENLSGDFDNDGHIDIISDMKNELYLNHGNLTFEAQDLPFKPAAIADFNNDGFLDVSQRSQLWLNNGNTNHWVKLKLKGNAYNTNGIGTRIKIKSKLGTQVRELRSGQGYSPMGTLDVHFGLGQDTVIDTLLIIWPSGMLTTMLDQNVDSTYLISETPCVLPTQKLPFADTLYLCKGDSLNLFFNEGFKQYLWSTGDTTSSIIVEQSGQYFVRYTDENLCSGISSAVFVQYEDSYTPMVKGVNQNASICQDSSLILYGVNDNSIEWSNGANAASIEVKESGKYYFAINAKCTNTKLYSDTVSITVTTVNAIEIEDIKYLEDSVKIKLYGQDCAIYNTQEADTAIYTSCDFTIANPTEDIVLYAENKSPLISTPFQCGKLDTAGFKNDLIALKQMYFSLWDDITLVSVDMYVNKINAEGSRMITITDKIGNKVFENNHILNIGKNTVLLNATLKAGNYTISCDRSDQLMNVGPQDYPYPIGDIGTIDSSSVSLNFYPYFYNWQVLQKSNYCVSERIPILIKAVGAFDIIDASEISLYPNPASDLLIVKGSEDMDSPSIEIRNMQGNKVNIKYTQMSNTIEIDTKPLVAGLYSLFTIMDNKVYNKKFIIFKH